MSTTLILGDCLEKMKEIPDGSVDMIFCDLPYGDDRLFMGHRDSFRASMGAVQKDCETEVCDSVVREPAVYYWFDNEQSKVV